MALSEGVVASIRDEIGPDPDFADADSTYDPAIHLDSLESIFTGRAGGSVLVTALICWRRRLNSLQARSFDLTTEGSLLNRNQRIRFLERQVWRLEQLVDETHLNRNMEVQGVRSGKWGRSGGAEFSP